MKPIPVWLKATAIVTLLVLLLAGLAVSSPGLRLAAYLAERQLPALTLNDVSGNLLSGVTVGHVAWQDDRVSIDMNNAFVGLDYDCGITELICIDALTASSVKVSLHSPQASANVNETTNAIEKITSPIPAELRQLRIDSAVIALASGEEIAVDSLMLSARFGRRLRIDPLTIARVDIRVPQSDNSQPAEPIIEQIKGWQFQPVQLPAISVPMDIIAPALALKHLRVEQNTRVLLDAGDLQLTATVTPKQIRVEHIAVAISPVTIKGELSLAADRAIAADVTVSSTSPWFGFDGVSAQISGYPENLQARVDVDGQQRISLDLQADVTIPQLPLNALLSWQSVELAVADNVFQSDSGTVSLQGNLDNYRLLSESDWVLPEVGQTGIEIEGRVNLQQLSLSNLHIVSDMLESQTQATVTLDTAAHWQTQTTVTRLKPGNLLPDIDARLTGQFVSEGYSDLVQQFDTLLRWDLQGQWQDYLATTKADMRIDSASGITIHEVSVHLADTELRAKGTLDTEQRANLTAHLNSPNLSAIHPTLGGTLAANAVVTGLLQRPEAQLNLTGEELRIENNSLGTLSAEVVIEDAGGVWPDNASVVLNARQLNIADARLSDMSFTASGNAQAHDVSLALNGEQVSLQGQLRGQLTNTLWQGDITQLDIAKPDTDLTLKTSDVAVTVDSGQGDWTVAPHCWQQSTASLCFTTLTSEQQQINVAANLSSLAIQPLASAFYSSLPVTTDLQISANMTGQWSPANGLTADVAVSAPPSLITFIDTGRTVNLRSLTASADAKQQTLDVEVFLLSPEFGQIEASTQLLQGNHYQLTDSHFVISNVDLQYLSVLDEALDNLAGIVSADVTLSHQDNGFAVFGDASLTAGAISPQGIQANLREIEQSLVFNGQHLTLDGSFMLGGGRGKIAGQFDWANTPQGALQVSGDELTVSDQQVFTASISPDVQARYANNNIQITGSVQVPKAAITVKELPQNAVQESADVVITDTGTEQTREPQISWGMDLDLAIDPLRKRTVTVDAFGLTSALTGSLKLRRQNNNLVSSGQLSLLDGRYAAYGQNLLINRGDVLFSGPLTRPQLSVDAIRDPQATQDGVIAGLRITGSAQSPEVDVFSEPAMPQSEALSYLLRGRGLGSGGADSQDVVLTNALLSFGLGQGENMVSTLGERVGIKDLNLNTSGQGANTQLALSGTLAPGVTLSYGVGVFDSISEVTLRYQLFPQLYLEAISGLNNALDLYYQFSLGNPPAVRDKTGNEAQP